MPYVIHHFLCCSHDGRGGGRMAHIHLESIHIAPFSSRCANLSIVLTLFLHVRLHVPLFPSISKSFLLPPPMQRSRYFSAVEGGLERLGEGWRGDGWSEGACLSPATTSGLRVSLKCPNDVPHERRLGTLSDPRVGASWRGGPLCLYPAPPCPAPPCPSQVPFSTSIRPHTNSHKTSLDLRDALS